MRRMLDAYLGLVAKMPPLALAIFGTTCPALAMAAAIGSDRPWWVVAPIAAAYVVYGATCAAMLAAKLVIAEKALGLAVARLTAASNDGGDA